MKKLKDYLYYKDDWCTIYCVDCQLILPMLEPVDLVLTDPPYNVGKDFGDKTDDSMIDYEKWCGKWFTQIQSKNILITPGIANLKQWLLRDPRWVIAWVKNNSMKRITIGFNCWEPILFWGKNQPHSYRDVIICPTIPQKINGHPTPKPQKLFSILVSDYSIVGNTVLDLFMGSGTTLVVAKNLNRKSIGIEIEEKYCKIAIERVSEIYKPKDEKFTLGKRKKNLGLVY